MSRISIPSPRRRRSSPLRSRRLWVAVLGGAGAVVAARGLLFGRSDAAPDYAAESKVDVTEGPAFSTEQTEVDDVAAEEVPAAEAPEAARATAQEAEVGAPGDDASLEAGAGDPAAIIDETEPPADTNTDAVVEASEPAAEVVPDRIEDGPAADQEEDPLVVEETEAARAEAGAIGQQPEDPAAA